MEQQLSFTDSEYQHKRRQIRKEKFLSKMDKLIPWNRLEQVIEPHYPKAGRGHRPYPLLTMLRIHCLQQWYSMSDPAMEDALYEISSMRLFTGLSLSKPIPDHTTIMNFRHLLGLSDNLTFGQNSEMTGMKNYLPNYIEAIAT